MDWNCTGGWSMSWATVVGREWMENNLSQGVLVQYQDFHIVLKYGLVFWQIIWINMSMATSSTLALLTCHMQSYDSYIIDCNIPCSYNGWQFIISTTEAYHILSYTHTIFFISISIFSSHLHLYLPSGL